MLKVHSPYSKNGYKRIDIKNMFLEEGGRTFWKGRNISPNAIRADDVQQGNGNLNCGCWEAGWSLRGRDAPRAATRFAAVLAGRRTHATARHREASAHPSTPPSPSSRQRRGRRDITCWGGTNVETNVAEGGEGGRRCCRVDLRFRPPTSPARGAAPGTVGQALPAPPLARVHSPPADLA